MRERFKDRKKELEKVGERGKERMRDSEIE